MPRFVHTAFVQGKKLPDQVSCSNLKGKTRFGYSGKRFVHERRDWGAFRCSSEVCTRDEGALKGDGHLRKRTARIRPGGTGEKVPSPFSGAPAFRQIAAQAYALQGLLMAFFGHSHVPWADIRGPSTATIHVAP